MCYPNQSEHSNFNLTVYKSIYSSYLYNKAYLSKRFCYGMRNGELDYSMPCKIQAIGSSTKTIFMVLKWVTKMWATIMVYLKQKIIFSCFLVTIGFFCFYIGECELCLKPLPKLLFYTHISNIIVYSVCFLDNNQNESKVSDTFVHYTFS